MIATPSSTNQALRRLWWLGPASLFAVVIGSTMLAAAWQSDAAFRLYGAPKFIAAKHILLAAAAIFVFAIGRRLAATTGAIPRQTPESTDDTIRVWFWITAGLTVFGYAMWALLGLKNGFSLSVALEFLTTDDPVRAETMFDEMFVGWKGVTTCTQFGVAAVPLGLWLIFRGQRRFVWPVGLLFFLAAARALMFSERLALIELAVPAIVIYLRMCVLGKEFSPLIRTGLKLAPLVGVVALVTLFGGFEYFRSWRYYRHDFDSFAEFTLWRVGGYYTTAHNNGAMALETQPPYPLPYATLRQMWSIPGLDKTPFGYTKITGLDPGARMLEMLEQYGTPELNSDGGLFQPALDFGLAGFVVFWAIYGFVAGRLYRSFMVGTLTGVTLYPLIFLSLLETPRFLYLSYTRSLPAMVTLIFIHWLTTRARQTASAPLPALATGAAT